MLTLPELLSKIRSYKPNFDEALVKKAYFLAKEAHGNQKRHSGDLYFSHPVAVAEILTELKLDEESIITALLHDVVEDTETPLEEIEKIFGDNVAKLVDGVTKLGKIESASYDEKIAENFRKLTLAMSDDIRVLLVKLADRLHNMRTISYMPSAEKKIKKARESLDIYAPLAGRIGLHKIKDEMQELSFAVINPEARSQIVEKLSEIREKNQNLIDKILADLKGIFAEDNFECEISGREKKPYPIWMKMKKQNIGFHNIYDIMAFRIVTKSTAECYRALGLVNSNYNMIPGTFKDYISTPKENGYQSLHLAILGPFSKKIEIQIRDKNMHEVSEIGVAAHWHYKEKFSKTSKGQVTRTTSENEKYRWIRELITLFENSENASDVLKQHKFSMQKSEVFCFTPNGDIFNLPFGSTVIDFAYAVHSQIGNTCVSAKVNGSTFPLRHRLENGDQVEIITESNAKPSPNWLQFAFTSKARSAIKSFIRSEKFTEYSVLGRAILNKFFAARGLEVNDQILEKILPNFNKKSVADLCFRVAEGVIARDDVLKAIYPEFKTEIKGIKTVKTAAKTKSNLLPIDGLIAGMAIHYATCCNPIPGDKIIGVINTGSGVAIHNQDCAIAKNIVLTPQRVVEVCWKSDEESSGHSYLGKIRAVFENKSGALANVTSIIAKNKINISSIKTTNRSKDLFEVTIDVEVKNIDHLEEVMSSLRISGKIIEVERLIG
jgi:GTP pyrophosphokinase